MDMLFDTLPLYLVLGVGVGICSGMLGLGGGIIIVPALALVFPLFNIPNEIMMQMILGTSLAIMVPTSLTSVLAHHRRKAVLWPIVWQLAPMAMVGTFVGAYVADYLPSDVLKQIFGVFIVIAMGRGIVARFLKKDKKDDASGLPGKAGMRLMGFIIGSFSAILGIGGGSITIPFLTACRVDMRNTIACSSACGLFLATSGSLGFLATGWSNPLLPKGAIGFIYWPAFLGIVLASVFVAPLGARLAHTLPTGILKMILAIGLVVMGIKMVFG